MSSANVYVVRPGDSADRIAARYTGDADRWPELTRVNPQATVHDGTLGAPMFRDLKVGQTIFVPRSWGMMPGAVPSRIPAGKLDFGVSTEGFQVQPETWSSPFPQNPSITHEMRWVKALHETIKGTAKTGAHMFRGKNTDGPTFTVDPFGPVNPAMTAAYKACAERLALPGGTALMSSFLHRFAGPTQLVAAFNQNLTTYDVIPSIPVAMAELIYPAEINSLRQACNAFIGVCAQPGTMGDVPPGTLGYGADENVPQEVEPGKTPQWQLDENGCDPGSPITDIKPYAFKTGGDYPAQVATNWTGDYRKWHELRRANYDEPAGFDWVYDAQGNKACNWRVWGGGHAIKIPASWPDVPAIYQNDIVDVDDAFPGTNVSSVSKAGMPWYWIPVGIAAALGLSLAWGARPKADRRAQKA
jgi:hypothetical protein